MIEIEFFVPGIPVAKGRPKFARSGNFVRAYTPEKTANYETQVSWYAHEAMKGKTPFELPIILHVMATMPIPASISKKKQAQMVNDEIAHMKRPDLTNIIKAIEDGMNGIVYKDDCQIHIIGAEKRYGLDVGVLVRARILNADV